MDPQFDPYWNVQSVIFKVEGVLFSVLKHGFMVKGTPFETMFSLPIADIKNVEGSRPDIPIVLQDTSAEDFRLFLRVLYPQGVNPVRKFEEWLGVLRLSHKWEFIEIRTKAIKEIDHFIHTKSPCEKMELGNRFLVSDWLKRGLRDIASMHNLGITELEREPYNFDQQTITKIFYIQSKTWQRKAKGEFGAYAPVSVIDSFISGQVAELFQEEIARATFVPQFEPEAPPKRAGRKRQDVESSDSD